MSAPKLTVADVVAVLRETSAYLSCYEADRAAPSDEGTGCVCGPCEVARMAAGVQARRDAEVEADEREEHARAMEDAERNVGEPW